MVVEEVLFLRVGHVRLPAERVALYEIEQVHDAVRLFLVAFFEQKASAA